MLAMATASGGRPTAQVAGLFADAVPAAGR